MSSVVVTGTGLLTAAGLGHAVLERALLEERSLLRERPDGLRCSDVDSELLFWPASVEWQAMRDYAGRASRLAVTACQQAFARATAEAAVFEPERCATITATGDDWSEQSTFDSALANAASPRHEAQALFSQLEDEFLLRTFRWGVGFAVSSLTGFQGQSIGIDAPSFGGLSGLCQAVDLLESGEVDAVMLVGVDTIPRLDVVSSLERLAHESHAAPLAFGQGAAAMVLERGSSALARGARPLARIVDCQLTQDDQPERALERMSQALRDSQRFSTASVLGTLFNAGSLAELCLGSEWLARQESGGTARSACSVWIEKLWSRGAGVAELGGFVRPAVGA